jgi:DNA polymerase V
MQDDIQALAPGDGVSVHSGFPNPAADGAGDQSLRLSLDLNQLLIKRPASTYLFRIAGHAQADEGIFDGDVAVVDRALNPQDSDLVVAWLPGGSVIARKRRLEPGAPVWGVVTAVIHNYRP